MLRLSAGRLAASLPALLLCVPLLLGVASPLVQPAEYPAERQVHQQIGGIGSIPVRGFYDDGAFPAAVIEARRGGGPWTVIDPAPSGGVFEGSLGGQAMGWGTLEVRIQGGPILYSIADVGVGDVYLIAGQSNAIMTTETLRSSLQPSSTVMLDPPAGQLVKWTADPLHEMVQTSFGSVWPLLADEIVGDTAVPVMYVATAESATGLVDTPDWAVGGFLWNRMLTNLSVATSGQDCVRAVLWFQGETDALRSVSYAAYKTALKGFAASLQGAVSCPTPLVAGVIGPFFAVSETALEAIRDAQRDAAVESANILPGPETFDLPTLDGLHFNDAAVPYLLERWCSALAGLHPGLLCPAAPVTDCGNGTDDDADGLVDLTDPGCDDVADATETSVVLVCDDGLDNDGDMLVDAADPGCANPLDPSELLEAACADSVDNDGDGSVDGADPGCSGPGDESEKDLLCLPSLPIEADTHLEHQSSSNFGDEEYVRVGPDNDGWHGLLRFDVSSLPAGKTISSAILRLFQEDSGDEDPIDVGAHRVDQSWTELGANWYSSNGSSPWLGGPGGTYSTPAVATTRILPDTEARFDWQLRPLVQEWSDGSSPNHGLLLRSEQTDGGERADFTSRDSSAASRRPQLLVCVTSFPCDDGVDNDEDGDIDTEDSGCTGPADPEEGKPSPCGNGTIDPGEQCDDGNQESGDCCSPTCQFEPAGQGTPDCCVAGLCNTAAACGAVCFGTGTCQLGGTSGDKCLCAE